MKIFLSFLFLLCFNILSYGQMQRNYAQELIDLLMNGRNFEAREFKLQHRDHLPPDDKLLGLIYNMHMSIAFNKPDSTIIYLEDFLSNTDNFRNFLPLVGVYYVRLCETYEGKQLIEKAISTVKRHLKYLKDNPHSLNPDVIKNANAEAQNKLLVLKQKLGNEPKIQLTRDNKDKVIKLKDGIHVRFDAQYNGHTVETNFDTGVSAFCFIEKDVADEIGVKYKPHQDSIRFVNGKSTKAIDGYVDVIELNGIKLYNIPVLVFIDKFSSNLPGHLNPTYRQDLQSSLLKSRQVLFGLPAMKMIGRFEFDWKSSTLVIPQKKVQNTLRKSLNPNMMLVQNGLFLSMKINETDFIGFLDSGSDHSLFLTYPYFFKSKCDYVKDDPQKQPLTRAGLTGVQENLERYRLENPQIYFGGRKIDMNNPQRAAYTVANINNFDGEVGIGFFKNNFSKTVIDFNTMTIECEN